METETACQINVWKQHAGKQISSAAWAVIQLSLKPVVHYSSDNRLKWIHRKEDIQPLHGTTYKSAWDSGALGLALYLTLRTRATEVALSFNPCLDVWIEKDGKKWTGGTSASSCCYCDKRALTFRKRVHMFFASRFWWKGHCNEWTSLVHCGGWKMSAFLFQALYKILLFLIKKGKDSPIKIFIKSLCLLKNQNSNNF